MDKWQNKVAVIAGSISSISVRILGDLVQSEVIVVLLARDAHKITLTYHEKSIRVYTCDCDVTNGESIKQAFKWIDQTLGGVHILINNPGCNKHPSNPLDVNGNDLASLANTNLLMGLLLCTKEAMVSMKNYNNNGYIINVNSHFDHKVPIILDTPPYNNNGLTALRKEITDLKTEKIRMTNLNPGLVRSEIVGTSKYPVNMSYNRYPTLSAEDITQAVHYILSAPAHVEISELNIKPAGL